MSLNARYAIITPYYREDGNIIERCITSVRNQSMKADHFLISDGFPQDWIDDAGVRHFKLDRCHNDFGNTPRGVGALIAIGEEYDGIGLLDADNWLEHNHIESCIAAANSSPHTCDYVVAKRVMRRPDETIMPVLDEPGHVDTNCFFFLRGSFSVIPHWAMMPRELAPACDRYFFEMIRRHPFGYATVFHPTVNYFCSYESVYRLIGETPPPGVKPDINREEIEQRLRGLGRRELEIARRLSGVPLIADPARNAQCPCGSGKKYKHCHGAIA